MSRRRRKKPLFDVFSFDEEGFLFEQEPVEGGSGYSISVTNDSKGKPVVRIKTHGDVDVAELRRDIEQRYPGARIEGLEKKPLIRIVDEEETRRKEEKPKKERKRKDKKGSLIKVVK